MTEPNEHAGLTLTPAEALDGARAVTQATATADPLTFDFRRAAALLGGYLDDLARALDAANLLDRGNTMTKQDDYMYDLSEQTTPYPAPTVRTPDIEDVMETVDEDEGCEATDGCWIEPDGVCGHGYPSWLLYWGMI